MKNQRFKNQLLTERKCINSILRFYSLSSLSELKDGLRWYNEANKYCRELAARFCISIGQSAGIIAAFSPQTGWLENKRFALSFLYNPTKRIKSLVQTNKAKNILNLVSESDIYNALSIANSGFKTKGFFLNMLNPDIITDVTIDRHAIACCIQHPDNVYALNQNYGKLTKIQYEFFQHCFIQAAKQLDILPHQLQAITWVTYRRIRDLRKHDTTTEWKPFINENPF